MKKNLALLLALVLVFSTITVAFAAEEINESAKVCELLGMLKGDGNGVTAEYLATQPTRLQAAVMFLRLKGLEEDALAWDGTENFADADQVAWEGGKKIMAYLYAHKELGWVGDAGKFNPTGLMTAQAYYKVMLETLGYKQNTTDVIGDFTWAGVLKFAAEVGLKEVANVTTFTVNDLAVATVEALVTPVKGSEATLAEVLVEMGVIEEEVAIAAGVMLDPVEAAILAAEEAIAALPEEITLEDMEAVLAAADLVAEALELDENAVIANVEVLEAALVALEELQAVEIAKAEALEAAEAAIAALPATITIAEKAAVAAARELVAAAQELGVEEIAGLDKLAAAEATIDTLESVYDVSKAEAYTNTKIKVSLNEAKTVAVAENFAVTDKDGKAVEVKSATLAADGKSVILETAAQTAYTVYTVKVNGKEFKYVAVPADTVKPTATALVDAYNKVKVTFTEKVDAVLATNIANYTVDNGLVVLKAELNSAGTIVTLTTSDQVVGTIYKITVQNVADLAGNVMDKVEALFGGMAKDTSKPSATALVVTNKTVEVTFTKAVNKEIAENIANYTMDNGLVVLKAELDTDDQSGTYLTKVTLTTSEQTVGTIYKITVQNVADTFGNVMDKVEALFGGMAKDTTKPTATALVVTNTRLQVTFIEKVDAALATNIANYTFDNGLVVLKAELNSAGTVVTLTTSEQTVGTIYKITVQNVADLSGNVMDKYEVLFGGMAKDTTKPTVVSAIAASTPATGNTVTITFSEVVDAAAANVLNYVFDGNLGYATTATATVDTLNNRTVVVLKTAAQEPGKIYSVTINGINDLSGNPIEANTKATLVGVGSVAATNKTLQAISVVNENTVDLIFDVELTNADVAALTVASMKENGAAFAPVGLDYAKLQQANKKVVRVQFKTTENNPSLFMAGRVYEATITGVANLVTANNANIKVFAGTNVTNPVPYVMTATALNTTAVKVTFSEPVKAVTNAAFAIAGVPVIGVSVQAADVVTEAILYLGTALTTSQVYDLTFNAGVLDAAGYNPMKRTNADLTAYTVKFAGTNVANAAPKMTAVVPVDRWTFDIYFSEAVNLGDAAYALVNLTNGTNLSLVGATYTQSADKTKLTVSLNVATTALVSGTVYELTLTTTTLADLQGALYDATTGANKVRFGGVDTPNALPAIAAASINTDNDEITVIFNEKIVAAGLDGTYFTVTGLGFTSITSATLQADGRTVVIVLATPLDQGQVATVKLSATGLANVKDVNNQAPSATVDAVQFGTR